MDPSIQTLSSYYGNAIRDSVGKTYPEMKNRVMAGFNHIFSTEDNPRHEQCPTGLRTWCYYQNAIAHGAAEENIKFQRSSLVIDLDEESQKRILGIYEALSTKELLERCVRGLSQNANESFHFKIWKRAQDKI